MADDLKLDFDVEAILAEVEKLVAHSDELSNPYASKYAAVDKLVRFDPYKMRYCQYLLLALTLTFLLSSPLHFVYTPIKH